MCCNVIERWLFEPSLDRRLSQVQIDEVSTNLLVMIENLMVGSNEDSFAWSIDKKEVFSEICLFLVC